MTTFVRLEHVPHVLDKTGVLIDGDGGYLLRVMIDGESAQAFIPGSVSVNPLDDIEAWTAFGKVLFQAVDLYKQFKEDSDGSS